MDVVYSTEDLKNFIRESELISESKPNENNIVAGYPFSGKKHLLYQILNDLDISFSIVYHTNILKDENYGKELNNILKIPNIDAYEFRDFDKIKNEIKGKIVFLLLPSKIFIEDNKEYGNNEEKKFKDAIKEIKRNHTLITIGRDYTYNYLFGKIDRTEVSKSESVIKKLVLSLRNYLKEKDRSNIHEWNKNTVKILCNKDEADTIFNNLNSSDGNMISNEMKEKILRHARINHGPYHNYYFPGLIEEGIDNIDDVNNEKIEDVEKFEKDLAIESSIFMALGISAPELLASPSISNSIDNILSKFSKTMETIVPIILPGLVTFGAGFAGAFLSILFTSSGKKSNFGGQIVKWSSLWNTMPQERREYIAYQYDILYHLTPGESLTIFNNIFGNELENFKKYFNNFIKGNKDNIDEIDNELSDLKHQINIILKRLEKL